MERFGERFRRSLENLKPENHLAVVAEIEVDETKPGQARVLLDRGERDVSRHGVQREFTEVLMPVRKIVQEGWAVMDLVHIGWTTNASRIGSRDDIKQIGGNVDQIYSRFAAWDKFQGKE